MTYREARKYLEEIASYGSVLGLDAIKELLKRLGNPERRLRFIHVAGTNGKGSTAAFISSILAEAGYLVGRYVSPTILSYLECIQISSKEIANGNRFVTEEAVSRHIERIREATMQMGKDGYPHPTVFEIETAMAFLEFEAQGCDVVVLEVGLGGRLDATNIIENVDCAVITSISMDHMQYLGDTIEEIAYEKVGIIKPYCKVVSGLQDESVMKVIRETCQVKEAELYQVDSTQISQVHYGLEGSLFDYKEEAALQIRLLGNHQIENAVLAVEVIQVLHKSGYHVTKKQLREGLNAATWPGRFQIIRTEPYFIIDGAHNEAAAKSLRNALETYFKGRRCIFIMGVLADKDYESILNITADCADSILTITPNNPRALSSRLLADVAKKYCRQIFDVQTLEQAIPVAYELAGKEDLILCFGSLSFLGDVLRLME